MRIKQEDFKFGFEIEMEYNDDEIDLNIEGYHDGEHEHNRYLKFESDSSIEAEEFGGEVEAITKPFTPKELPKVLKEFKYTFGLHNQNLHDILNFNTTTGCHFHVSYKGTNPSEFFQFNYAKSVMRRIDNGVKKILGEDKFKRWKQYSTRYYAKNTHKWSSDKYYQVRLHPDYNTVEFRFFHLLGVETFEELEQMFKLAINSTIKTFRDFIKRPHEIRQFTFNPSLNLPEDETRYHSFYIHSINNEDNATITIRNNEETRRTFTANNIVTTVTL